MIIFSFITIAISNTGKKFLIETVFLKNIFLLPLLIFSVGFFISLNRSVFPYESITAYLQVVFIFLVAYPLLVQVVKDEKQINFIAVMLILPGIVISMIMIILKILSIDIGIDLLAYEGWRGRLTYGGMEPSIPGRIILQNIPLLAVYALTKKSKKIKMVSVILILIQSLAIFLTASRANFLTFIIGLVLFVIFVIKYENKIQIRYVVFTLLISILIITTVYNFDNEFFLRPFERYSTILQIKKSASSLERIKVIDMGFNYINRNPFIGLGMDNSHLYTKISVHNPVLLTWVENGVFGMIGFTTFYLILLFQGIKCYNNKFFGSYLLIGLTIVMVMMVFGDMFMANSYKRVLWLPALLFFVHSRNLSSNRKDFS
ncbi:MAG: O-antigen ligase family protein [Candidatus Marinimicrobia bacterium]|nr:O-antigen ligase family protein [Candidatus Neomarinimicrobiota bacterium]